ncbi:MAG: type II toxin-antitoxin system PemK/MazF family toxin [Selenomonadaceae bacterium]|nr:type II toxin-antitoxin system PemK/MazF family toxin [Selenomonadaceae bacterium]
MKQGDIVWVNLNPVAGHEQGNFRPAIIVDRDEIPLPSNLRIVVPITSKSKGYPLELPLLPGMKTSGYALPFQVRTLDVINRQAKVIEHAPQSFVDQCCSITAQLIKS